MTFYNKILYILIASESKPLAGYGNNEFKESEKMCEGNLEYCNENKGLISYPIFELYQEKIDNIIYLLSTSKYPKKAAALCLDSLKKEFSTFLHGKNFENVEKYGLNSEMQEKIKLQYEYYNKDPESISGNSDNIDITFKVKELNPNYDDKLAEMENKAKQLDEMRFNIKKEANEKKKKSKCIIF